MATPTSLPASFTSGQVLTAAQMNDLRGAFRILQVVSTTKTDTFTTTSTSFTDVTGLSLSITPSSATSKVLVFSTLAITGDAGQSVSFGLLVRDSTALFIGDAAGSRIQASFYGDSDPNNLLQQGITYLDSPATTSATTYKVQVRSGASPGVTYVNRTETDTNNNQYSRSASSITALEVSG